MNVSKKFPRAWCISSLWILYFLLLLETQYSIFWVGFFWSKKSHWRKMVLWLSYLFGTGSFWVVGSWNSIIESSYWVKLNEIHLKIFAQEFLSKMTKYLIDLYSFYFDTDYQAWLLHVCTTIFTNIHRIINEWRVSLRWMRIEVVLCFCTD